MVRRGRGGEREGSEFQTLDAAVRWATPGVYTEVAVRTTTRRSSHPHYPAFHSFLWTQS